MTTVEMTPDPLARGSGVPTTFVSGSGKDGHSPFPPEGGNGGSLTVRKAVDATWGSPGGDPQVADR